MAAITQISSSFYFHTVQWAPIFQ